MDQSSQQQRKAQAMMRAMKQYKVSKKRARYRECVIKELIKTESDYTRDLNIVIERVMKPTAEGNLLPQALYEGLFMNLRQIAEFNMMFLGTMTQGYQGYFPCKVVFGETCKQVGGFSIYFDYCNGYTESTKILQQVQTEFKEFESLLGEVRRSNVMRGMNLDDFLVKPVQRLPKYVLLFKDLLKHTDHEHRDHENIKVTLHEFQDVNDANNKNMDKFMNRMRIQEFDKTYNLSLMADADRLFRFEETQTAIWNEVDRPVLIYAMSDVVLVTYRNEQELSEVMKIIYLDSSSFVKDQPNSLIFKNLYTLVGKNDAVQFTEEDLTNKKRRMALLEKLIAELRAVQKAKMEKSMNEPFIMQYPVEVVVAGTEERNFQSFSKHTTYITEVKILKIVLKIFVRYREIQKLCETYKKRYSTLHLPNFSSKQWLNNHQTKLIEQRKLAIENFLQIILSSEETRADVRVLEELNLPRNFHQLPDLIQSAMQVSGFGMREDFRESLSQYGIDQKMIAVSAAEIWRARQMTEEVVHISSIVKTDMGVNQPGQGSIQVLLMDGETVKVGISAETRAAEVVEAVARHINLQCWADFKIYIVDQLDNARTVDDDEVISKVVQDEADANSGVMHQVLGKMESIFFAVRQQRMRLEMRKFLYLPIELEEYDYKNDLTRLRLTASQVFHEVRAQSYQLGFKEYCFYAALYIYIRCGDKFFPLPIQRLHDVIPKQIYETVKESQWKESVLDLVKQLSSETNKIGTDNLRQSQMRGTKEAIISDPVILTQRVVLNSIKTNNLFGMTQYFVEMTKKTREQLKRELKGLGVPNIYLGVTFEKLYLLTPSKKEVIKYFPLSKISNIQSYPMQIIFDFMSLRLNLKFLTHQSYEIKMLVTQYSGLQTFAEQFKVGLVK